MKDPLRSGRNVQPTKKTSSSPKHVFLAVVYSDLDPVHIQIPGKKHTVLFHFFLIQQS
jgi:hypothetical protein